MKKIFFYMLTLMLATVGLASCNDDKDALTDSVITYYPEFHMLGNEFEEVFLGTSYTDAGCTATLLGEDWTSHIVTTGVEDIDVNVPGLYYITYSIVNKDGYEKSVTRTVAVFDPEITTDISGKYITQEGTCLIAGTTVIALDGYTVNVDYVVPGVFYIDEMLAGMWSQRAGYGADYGLQGYLQLTADNKLHDLGVMVPGWEDTYDEISDIIYDPENEEITYSLVYAGYDFNVILKKSK